MERLVPDELWELFQRVVPQAPSRPQGGGRRWRGDREVMAAIVFVATSGYTWRQLAPVFDASRRRRTAGSRSGARHIASAVNVRGPRGALGSLG